MNFVSFIWRHHLHRNLLLSALGLSILQAVLFHQAYHYPVIFGDSLYYIENTTRSNPAGLSPIGFPVFLRWLHYISNSAAFFFYVQYGLLQLSTGLFFFTMLFQYPLGISGIRQFSPSSNTCFAATSVTKPLFTTIGATAGRHSEG